MINSFFCYNIMGYGVAVTHLHYHWRKTGRFEYDINRKMEYDVMVAYVSLQHTVQVRALIF